MTNDSNEDYNLMEKTEETNYKKNAHQIDNLRQDDDTVTSEIIKGPRSFIAAAAAKASMLGKTYDIIKAIEKKRRSGKGYEKLW